MKLLIDQSTGKCWMVVGGIHILLPQVIQIQSSLGRPTTFKFDTEEVRRAARGGITQLSAVVTRSGDVVLQNGHLRMMQMVFSTLDLLARVGRVGGDSLVLSANRFSTPRDIESLIERMTKRYSHLKPEVINGLLRVSGATREEMEEVKEEYFEWTNHHGVLVTDHSTLVRMSLRAEDRTQEERIRDWERQVEESGGVDDYGRQPRRIPEGLRARVMGEDFKPIKTEGAIPKGLINTGERTSDGTPIYEFTGEAPIRIRFNRNRATLIVPRDTEKEDGTSEAVLSAR
jgi:hypothetical protein